VVPIDPDMSLPRRSRAYGMKAVIRRICDADTFFELKPNYARNIITALTGIGGVPVGVLANAPMRMAGGLTPECCLKAVSFVCLSDAFGIPLLVLQDTPGFLISAQAERDRAIVRVMTLLHAMSQLTVPAVSVVIRKAFGLAFVILDGNRQRRAASSPATCDPRWPNARPAPPRAPWPAGPAGTDKGNQ